MSTKKKKDDCGCGHDHGVEDMHTIVITNDDGSEMEFDILSTLEYKTKKYIALLPRNFMVYEYQDKSEGMELIDIEDEKIMEEVGAKFEELLSCEEEAEDKK